MNLKFTKMHGLGNDFIVIDCRQDSFSLSEEQIRKLADRHYGIGFDQLLVIGTASSDTADVSYRIYNGDGGEVSQCGNGARCIATYLYEKNLIRKEEIIAETHNGLLTLVRLSNGDVRINMGVPVFEPDRIPLLAEKQQPTYTYSLPGKDISYSALAIGNPHAVVVVENTAAAPVAEWGQALQNAGIFPQGVNVGFMQVIDSKSIKLRVYERGVGETLACGSGACAAVIVGINAGILENRVDVSLQGGNLLVSWIGDDNPVWLTGPATVVYEGQMTL